MAETHRNMNGVSGRTRMEMDDNFYAPLIRFQSDMISIVDVEPVCRLRVYLRPGGPAAQDPIAKHLHNRSRGRSK